MFARARCSRAAALTVALLASAAVAGCGADPASDDRDALAEELREETGGALDEATARCVSEGLRDGFGDDSFEQIVDAASGRGTDAEAVRMRVIDVFAGCDALGPIIDDAP